MLKRFRIPFVALLMAYYLAFFYTSPATAGMIDTMLSTNISASTELAREMELQKIQRALENKVVQEKLKAFGLSDTEIKSKIKDLSDKEILRWLLRQTGF